jgi:hypothetical protein
MILSQIELHLIYDFILIYINNLSIYILHSSLCSADLCEAQEEMKSELDLKLLLIL